jgi:hypothetical protein
MKKLLAIVLALTTLLCLAACGSDSDSGYKAKTIEENLKKANYDVDVTDDAEEIAEEFTSDTITFKILPNALVEAYKDDGNFFFYVALFKNEADAKAFLDEWNTLMEGVEDQAELTLKGNCVYTGDEASVKIAFQ